MRRVMERSDACISWMDEAKLADLDFADDIALLEESVYSMPHSHQYWKRKLVEWAHA